MKERDICIALNQISGIGYVRFSALEKHFGGAGQIAGHRASDYRAVPGLNAVVSDRIANADLQNLADQEKSLADRGGVRLLTLYDEAYPGVLRELHDPPLCLYVRGRLPHFPCPSIAVVGSRRMSRYGAGMAQAITADAVSSGYLIVSGLAYGVDTIAHRTAVEAGGTTIAVLGGGLLHVHPQDNIPLAQDIIERGGALVTEFPLDCPVSRTTFPRRNRIIAALSQGTLVVEAGLKSGALHTVQASIELGHEIFAVPGQVTNELAQGCHQLIRDGACLTESFDDIRHVLQEGFQPSLLQGNLFQDENTPAYIPDSFSDLDPVSADVLQYITSQGVSLEELENYTGADTAQLLSSLMQLEFKLLIKRGGDMLYYPMR